MPHASTNPILALAPCAACTLRPPLVHAAPGAGMVVALDPVPKSSLVQAPHAVCTLEQPPVLHAKSTVPSPVYEPHAAQGAKASEWGWSETPLLTPLDKVARRECPFYDLPWQQENLLVLPANLKVILVDSMRAFWNQSYSTNQFFKGV